MARDRSSSKIRDLEGINRQLVKKLKQAHRDNARLQKILERVDHSEPVEAESEVEVKPKKEKKSSMCPKCASETKPLEVMVRGVPKTYIICTNARCKFRSKNE